MIEKSDFEKKIDEAFGMVTVMRGKNAISLLDIDVGQFVTLFDESNDYEENHPIEFDNSLSKTR